MTTYIKPTVLYIKQHSITGLKYFGKTTRDPLKYNGSGKHWNPHIKKHGKKYVINLWVSEPFTDSIAISEFALAFSRDNNIVESEDWANIDPENGLDGGVPGVPSPLKGESSGRKGKTAWNKGKPTGPRGPQQNPSGPRGKQQNPAPKVECPHCGSVGGGNMKRWHFDNCPKKPVDIV